MASLKDALARDRSRLTPIEKPELMQSTPPAAPPEDQRVNPLVSNPQMQCPLPFSYASADNIRQAPQVAGQVPYNRLMVPNAPPTSGSTVTETVSGSSSSGSSGGGSSTTSPTVSTVNITTPALSPSQIFTTSVQMAKGFLALKVTANSFCRVELYGTKASQTLDQSRTVLVAPANTIQGLISDVVLLGALTWDYVNTVGSNQDSPQGSTIYVTITNLSTAVNSYSVSIQFVEMES